MDLHMPEMDGYETTLKVREMEYSYQREIPIVALTAAAIKGEKEKCLSIGMDDYISKPFEPEDLIQLIHKKLKKQSENIAVVQEKEKVARLEDAKNEKGFTYVDLSYLETVSEGDKAFMDDLLNIFREQVPVLSGKLQEHLDNGDIDKLAAVAHKAKSSVAMLGINELKTAMENLEKWAKQKINKEKYPEIVENFHQISKLVLEEIKDLKYN
jgi:CheY-like chemotaxis protein